MDMHSQLAVQIKQEAAEVNGVNILTVPAVEALAHGSGASIREVEIAALRQKVLPARYQRSIGTVGWDGQVKLLESGVAVIGAGGLGGYVVEGLARMGVGKLTVVDGDVFEAHNLNRQVLCTTGGLGKSKAESAAARVMAVNPAVEVRTVMEWAGADNLPDLLQGVNVVVDALDNLPTRFVLQDTAMALGLPMVHGAIAGYISQVMTIFPGDAGLVGIYGQPGDVPAKGIEVYLGNPAGTPMLCAACQVQEVVKVITGTGEVLRNRLLMIDSETWDIQTIVCG